MEESKDLQTLYKVFRTFIYVSLIVEFFEYAINPDVLDHWGGILVEIHDVLNYWMCIRTVIYFTVR